ncbi:11150_t:CDS:10 [Diversispora eburnea]|uniref:11150_t:CDS:1 n=1 Tax=Diversispora eburnea TaxID=1213867 RepID=A0A9N8VB40_9GLOM|nr:11150_t:CDS:10 [Diversispora eburnea]
MASINYDKIKTDAAQHPKPQDIKYTHGTAGFRMKVGILAGLRSKKLDGKVIGVMITASHNREIDNGVKLVDPYGEMLHQSWEGYATQLANAQTEDELVEIIKTIVKEFDIDETKPSKTTPQLHYVTCCLNTQGTEKSYGEPTEAGYYKKLANAYRRIMEGKSRPSLLYVDSANGVGAIKLKELSNYIDKDILDVIVLNDDIKTQGKLNHLCGADYVKSNQRLPIGINIKAGERAASFDGDADHGTFRLFDGDKISSLAGSFIIDLVKAAGLEGINVGVVQTAYANGSSTHYLEKVMKVPVSCVPTGVKHLHHEAEKFDIGIYFEANGHGTILFSPTAMKIIQQEDAIERLRALTELINQTVGDALSDLLLVEAILANRQWTLKQCNEAYKDLPNRLVKVIVTDRHIFKTTNAERTLVEPAGLQGKIDALVGKYKDGRSFCDELAYSVSGLVYDEAGGTGGRPDEFL